METLNWKNILVSPSEFTIDSEFSWLLAIRGVYHLPATTIPAYSINENCHYSKLEAYAVIEPFDLWLNL